MRADRPHTRLAPGCLCACAIALAIAAPTAGAAIATNGLIAFETTGPVQTIETIDPVATDGRAASRRPVPLLRSPAANAAWSADGTMLAYSSTIAGNADIYVINADGLDGPRRVTRDPVAAIDPTWSPDGRRIAYTSLRDGPGDLYVTDVAGGATQRLTFEPGIDRQAEWSPDGRQIAFETDRNGNLDIWLMATDGSGQSALTGGPADEAEGAWSPDSRRLAFSSGAPGSSQREIRSIERSGANAKQLTDLNSRSGFPAWSPDGEQIVFAQDGASLYLMPSAGLGGGELPEFLTAGATDPVWGRLPPPFAQPRGTVEVDTPGAGGPQAVSSALTLPTGTKVDATDGSLRLNFNRPDASAGTPSSIAFVQGAEFVVESRTPDTLTLRLASPECPAGPVRAAKKARRRPKAVTKVKDKRGANFKYKDGQLSVTPERTEFLVTQTCNGSQVRVTQGIVKVRPRKGGRRGDDITVRQGHSFFVPR